MEKDPRKSGQDGQSTPREPLRDWQKDTWYGPYPMHDNPFDEPEDAPELREMRSDELNNRSGEFWQTQTNGYRFGMNQPAPERTAPEPEKKKNPRQRRALRWIVTLAVLAAVFFGMYYGVFAVREIRVTGNSEIPAAEVIRLSGIRVGNPILSLDPDRIERGIEQNPMLKFRYMEKELPGTVLLCVREREACCWMTWNGILYKMDKQRTVLEEWEDLTKIPEDLVRVDGLRVRSGAIVGQTLVLESQEQQEVFSALFLEMKVLGCTGLIESADLSSLDSLLLTTRDGFTVSLGNAQNIHAKLRSMLLTRERLLQDGYRGGVINVVLPENPIYSPSSV